MSGLQPVHVRVNDAASGKPTPCRVRFTDAAGKYYAPYGRLTEFATAYGVDVGGNVLVDGKPYAYINGACEIDLPPGVIHVEIHKGPEYKSVNEHIHLQAGKLALRLTIERWINMRELGWYSGDTRCHFLTPHDALLEGMAEDLAVVNLLAMQRQIPEPNAAEDAVQRHVWSVQNLTAFSGQKPALEAPGHMVVVNTLNWHPWLGRLALLNCHRVVYPLRFGSPGYDNWTLSDWCDQCHRKRGLVVWSGSSCSKGEAVANAILGTIDAMEVDDASWKETGSIKQGVNWEEWHLNLAYECLADCGFYLPVVGASGKSSNSELLGGMRTFAHIPTHEPLTYAAWIDAVRIGRVFVTKGPLLQLTVNGRRQGSTLTVPDTEPHIRIEAEAWSDMPFDRIEVLYPGGKLKMSASQTPAKASIVGDIRVNGSGTIVMLCYGAANNQDLLAFTSPIGVRLQGHPRQPVRTGNGVIEQWLNQATERLNAQGRFEGDAQRERIAGVLTTARERLRRNVAPV